MAPPVGTVVGRFVFPQPVKGFIRFVCTARGPLQMAGESAIYLPTVIDVPFPTDGELSQVLAATDSTEYNPSNFTWRVEFHLTDNLGRSIGGKPFHIAVPAGVEVDLATEMPIAEAHGVFAPSGGSGVPGPMGPAGPRGLQGIQGVKGDTGTQGPKGDTGAQGIQGIQGIQGLTGPAGHNPITVSATPPLAPAEGDIWFDIS